MEDFFIIPILMNSLNEESYVSSKKGSDSDGTLTLEPHVVVNKYFNEYLKRINPKHEERTYLYKDFSDLRLYVSNVADLLIEKLMVDPNDEKRSGIQKSKKSSFEISYERYKSIKLHQYVEEYVMPYMPLFAVSTAAFLAYQFLGKIGT